MNKKTYNALAKVFGAEIGGALFQSKAKIYEELESDGMVTKERLILGGGLPVRIEGWALTERGRILFCEACSEIVEV
jgi:hypothetical protein